jgi:hypothetical protein
MRFTNGVPQFLCFHLIWVARFTMPTALPILTAVARIMGFVAFTGGGIARVGGGSAPERHAHCLLEATRTSMCETHMVLLGRLSPQGLDFVLVMTDLLLQHVDLLLWHGGAPWW